MKAALELLKTTLKLCLVAAIGVGGWYAYQTWVVPEEEVDELGGLPTVVSDVRDITVSVSATGVLQPIRVVEVKSKASGEILEMPVEMGDRIEQGDLIAQVDTETLSQELKQAEADHESARVRLEIAEKQYQRAESLHAQGLISENDLESSRQTFTNAEGQALRTEATVQLARERLDDATVTAPIAGTIIAKQVEEGTVITSSMSNVSGGTVLVQMANLGELEIRTLVDEIDIGQVKPGLAVLSTVEAYPDREFEGEVIKIEPQAVVQQSVTTFPVLSRIDNDNGLLLPGMNADVQIIIHRRPRVLAVPNEAIRTVEDARRVVELLGLEVPESLGEEGRVLLASMKNEAVDGPSDGATGPRPGGGGVTAGNGPDSPDDGASENGDGVPSEERLRELMAQMARQGGGGPGGSAGRAGDAGSSGRRGGGGGGASRFAGRPGGGGMDLSDASVRARVWERIKDRVNAGGSADDPWGAESGRREQAVVFVMDAMGEIGPREIVVGVRDWEYTEVLAGLEAGTELVVLPSVSLLESQQRLRERFSRRGGGIPGIGG